MKTTHLLLVGSLCASGIFLAVSAQAALILPPGATWEYTFTDPTGDGTWNTTTGAWSTGAAPFGNSDAAGDFQYATLWPAGDGSQNADGSWTDDLWVRTTIDLTCWDLDSVTWDLGVDNGFKLYANGVLVGSDNAEGFTSRWEYSGSFGGNLVAGLNVIALALEDHGGATAFDMQINGRERPGACVPEGGVSVLLFGIGLVGLGGLRRTFRRSGR